MHVPHTRSNRHHAPIFRLQRKVAVWRSSLEIVPGESRSAVGLGRRLNQVDEVATRILKQYGGDWPHNLWLTTKADTKRLQTSVLRVDVVRYERSRRNASVKQGLL